MILEEEFEIFPDEEKLGKVSTVAELCEFVANS